MIPYLCDYCGSHAHVAIEAAYATGQMQPILALPAGNGS